MYSDAENTSSKTVVARAEGVLRGRKTRDIWHEEMLWKGIPSSTVIERCRPGGDGQPIPGCEMIGWIV
ncbi:MAG: hypothetical protein A2Y76_15510 [Planctomycetes bacterium RBG_13_60_9]|nr:MAG: hypothetical protein A2Y76_15510 [Planctomycetes bacterium RBG_13_60_9]